MPHIHSVQKPALKTARVYYSVTRPQDTASSTYQRSVIEASVHGDDWRFVGTTPITKLKINLK